MGVCSCLHIYVHAHVEVRRVVFLLPWDRVQVVTLLENKHLSYLAHQVLLLGNCKSKRVGFKWSFDHYSAPRLQLYAWYMVESESVQP